MKRSKSKSRSPTLLTKINRVFGTNKESFIKVDNNMLGEEYNLGYGEITNHSFKNIKNFLKKVGKYDIFIDLGCGSGRSLALALNNGFKYAKGVEIVEERYNYAVKSLKKITNIKNKYEIICSDIFNLKKSFFGSECVIFISNLLFPKETTHKIIKFLNDNVKKDTIIFLTVIPSELYDFQIVDRIETPMSWSSDSKCYVLKKNS
jgi:SAM-dependent methyltransferase